MWVKKVKKIKNFWRENKVVILLVTILVLCCLGMCSVALTYFFGGNDSVYGDRLDSNNAIDESSIKKDLVDYALTNELVEESSMSFNGRVIYIHVKLVEDSTLKAGKSLCSDLLTTLDEEVTSYYDVNFVLTMDESEASDSITILGAKNKLTEGIVWNNNTPIEVEEEKE